MIKAQGDRCNRNMVNDKIIFHRLFHKRSDPFPGNRSFLYRIEEFGRMACLDGKLGKAGKVSGKGSDVPGCPAGSIDVSGTEIDDNGSADHGNGII